MKQAFEQHLLAVRSAALKACLDLGVPPTCVDIVWDQSGPQNDPAVRYAIPESIRAQATPHHIAFWNRQIESRGDAKPKTIDALDAEIRNDIISLNDSSYEGLFPKPNPQAILARYDKIRRASLEEAIEFPPDWLAIRAIPTEELEYHIRNLCQDLTKQRTKTIQAAGGYLLREMDRENGYHPAEISEILANAARFRWSPTGAKQKIAEDNEVLPHELNANLLSRIVNKMRAGTPTQESFAQSIREMSEIAKERNQHFTGWKTYEQTDKDLAADTLQKDLAATNWCTGGSTETAKAHLSNGPFYVYYQDGDPQIAIRTNNNEVAEIRGRGQGQALTTPELRAEAERFLLAGKGPARGDDYLWDQNFRRACVKFQKTGEVNDTLLHTFNQNGEWLGAKPKMGAYGQETFEEGYTKGLEGRTLAPDQIERTDENGDRHLLCNFVATETNDAIFCPYASVAGDISVKGYSQMDAPDLTHVDGRFDAPFIQELNAPRLHTIEGIAMLSSIKEVNLPSLERTGSHANFDYAQSAHLPNLRFVTGNLMLSNCKTDIELEELEHIRGNLSAHVTKKVSLPNFRALHGSLLIEGAKEAHLPSLVFLGGNLLGKNLQNVDFPELATINGWVNLRSAQKVSMPELHIAQQHIAIQDPKILHAPQLLRMPRIFVTKKPKIEEYQREEPPELPREIHIELEKSTREFRSAETWHAKLQGNQITLNAAALNPADPDEVAAKIRHEIGHLVWRDPAVHAAFAHLWLALPKEKRDQIKKLVTQSYPSSQRHEEARVRAFEILSAGPKTAWEKFFNALQEAWAALTGQRPLALQTRQLCQDILERGIEELKAPEPESELRERHALEPA
jgi:hypothetical protein